MLRVTGGELRGRRLRVPEGVRPTTDLVRKAIFDLMGDVTGVNVLDACAGSGALGIEALSRGASGATFVEADRQVVRVLTGNLESVGVLERSRVLTGKVADHLGSLARGEGFGLILHDPPYEEESDGDVAGLLRLLADGGALVHERGDDRNPVCGADLSDRRRYGSTRLVIFRR